MFNPGDHVFLIGEGDLSFAVALVQSLGKSISIVATALDSESAVRSKHKEGLFNMKWLRAAGVQVECGTDCPALNEVNGFRSSSTKIVFKFPYLEMDRDQSVEGHRELLRSFFASAVSCLKPSSDAEICVTIKSGEP